MNPLADAGPPMDEKARKAGKDAHAQPNRVTVSVFLLWAVGAVGYAAIVLAFTPFTFRLDAIKVTLLWIAGPLAAALTAVALLRRRTQPLHPWPALALGAYIFLGLLSTLLADYRWRAWQEWGFELCFIAGFAAVALTASTERRFKNFCGFFFAVGFATVLLGLFHYFGGVSWLRHHIYPTVPKGRPPRLYALFMTLERNPAMFSTILNRDFYPAYLIMVAPLSGAFFLAARKPAAKLFFAVAGFLFALCIVLAGSNDSNIALAVMAATFFALLARWRRAAALPKRALLSWIGGSAVLVGSALYFLRSFIQGLPSHLQVAVHSRAIIWSGAWHIFFDLDRPVGTFLRRFALGSGPGGFMILFPRYRSPDYHLWQISPITLYSHSQVLDLLSERGLLGLAAFGAFLAAIFVGLGREIRRRPDNPLSPFQIALFTALVGITVQNLTSPNIRWTVCGLTYWFLLGLCTSAGRLSLAPDERAQEDRRFALPQRAGRYAATALFAAALVFMFFAIPFGLRRFIAATYDNEGRIKATDLTTLIGRINAASELSRKQQIRQLALRFARAAESDFERSIEWLPTFLNGYYQIAHTAGRRAALATDPKEVEEAGLRAIDAYKRLGSLAPDYAEMHTGLGLLYQFCYSRTKDASYRRLALAELDKATSMTTALRTQWLYATTLSDLGEEERALSVCRRILDLAPRCARNSEERRIVEKAIERLLTYAKAKGDLAQVEDLYRQRLAEHPFDAESFVGLADCLAEEGRDNEVLELCREWIERNPLDPLPRNIAAEILLKRGDRVGALLQIEAMIRIQHNRRPAVAGPWRLSVPGGKVADLRDPRLDMLWFRAGELTEALGRTGEALACYRQAIKLAGPRSPLGRKAQKALEKLEKPKRTGPKKQPLRKGGRQ